MHIQNVNRSDALRLSLGLPFYIVSSFFRHTNGTLGQLMRAVKNWWSAIFVYFGFIESANLRFRNGIEFRAGKKDLGKAVSLAEFANIPEAARKRLRLVADGDYATMLVGRKRLRLELEVANAVAIELYTDEHAMINVKNKNVVDIGAYVDNTAIYYALARGAKHVYAFEPYPYIYRTAVRNVKSNGLSSKISTYNYAVSGVSGSASLDANFTSFGMVDSGTPRAGKSAIRVVSLDSIVKSLGIKHGALKIDCEGCEYGIFKHISSRTLNDFDVIHIEYHYGYRDMVERLLGEGYAVTYTKPIYNFRGFGKIPMLKGHIVATKKN